MNLLSPCHFENDPKHHTTALHVFCAVAEQSGDGGCAPPLGHASVLLFAFALERVLTSEDKG